MQPDQSIDENQRVCSDDAQRPGRSRNKSEHFKPHEVEMSDMNAHDAGDNRVIDHNENVGPGSSFAEDSKTDMDVPADDAQMMPTTPDDIIADEVIGTMDDDAPKAFNLYRIKKLISHGMMDVALFSANANQLRYVFEASDGSAIYVIAILLLLISIFLQILVGIALLLSARYNVTNSDQRKMAFKLGNYVIVGIFLITVVNIFITSFGGPTVTPPTILAATSTDLPVS